MLADSGTSDGTVWNETYTSTNDAARALTDMLVEQRIAGITAGINRSSEVRGEGVWKYSYDDGRKMQEMTVYLIVTPGILDQFTQQAMSAERVEIAGGYEIEFATVASPRGQEFLNSLTQPQPTSTSSTKKKKKV